MFLHHHPEFSDLLTIVAEHQQINDPALIEKDYWIMHCLYGLQQQGFQFELKGGTSLSKAFGIIDRFSEDIDLRITPPEDIDLKVGKNHDKSIHIQARQGFYQSLADKIDIDGIISVKRDEEFDDDKLRSAGIRLSYEAQSPYIAGLKDGILLEVGFDNITPNRPCDISSWAYDYACDKVNIIDNRAKGVSCYSPAYTFVEKLQAISTKYRKQQETGAFPQNFMRHYYDVHKLLEMTEVQDFIGTKAYFAYKQERFPKADNTNIAQNDAFLINNPKTRKLYADAYHNTAALYYREHPAFEDILKRIAEWRNRL